ncbi:MAG: hypothetical protein CMG07_03600 [Candidatus Marinimicrobia bacterium]|nr:hypothetical protein [Candidatus Neomarinimicrobiota bacterium]|tara:strand:+ start:814 stop:3393 length:2580 start_codon:yes stop_codon:yes gene_type:complete
MIKIIFYIILTHFVFSSKININTITQDELKELPISKVKQIAIQDYLIDRGYISNIYDLLDIKDITSYDVSLLKKVVNVKLPFVSDTQKKISSNSYKLENWLSSDGNSEGLSEVWLDRFYEPMNINKMNYDDIMLLPNITPVDANAVMLQKKRGEIRGTFELKNSPGISYYGYKNLRDFILYEDSNDSDFHFRLSSLIRTVPSTNNPDSDSNIFETSNSSNPETLIRLSASKGQHIKFGLSYHKSLGESFIKNDFFGQNLFYNTMFENMKYSFSYEKVQFNKVRLDRLVLGNFTASFNQGVVFESSDYFSPRRTGYQWTKRAEGIHTDISRSSQYVLRGLGLQLSNDFVRGSFFISKQPRDAIINNDKTDSTEASFSSLIVMQPRKPYGIYSDTTKIFNKLTDSVNEITWGANIRYTPITGYNFGLTLYESLYDRVLEPMVLETIVGGPDVDYSGDDKYLQYLSNSADPEIAAMYSSNAQSPIWDKALSFRRVIGLSFSLIKKNIVFEGEYGELSKNSNIFKLGDEPYGLVLNTYFQFENFNLIALYRDYSLDFDNPYQRSFSNYQRYKTTIFEDTYWLEDPIYGYLYSANPQPQAERGLYLSSRYQFHRSFVGTLNWDNWTRIADNTKYFRTVFSIEYRPVFNYRIKIRQKFQGRGSYNIYHPSPFDSRETRVTARLRLSNFDQLELVYSNNFTSFSPRPRLTNNALSGESEIYDPETNSAQPMSVGSIGAPEETIGFALIHNFNNRFKMKGSVSFIEGFFWSFEDTDFRIFDYETQSVHSWLSCIYHLGSRMTIRYKISHTKTYPFTNVYKGCSSNIPSNCDFYDEDTGESQNEQYMIEYPNILDNNIDFRLQVDYAF